MLMLSDLQGSSGPPGTSRVNLDTAGVEPETQERRSSLISVIVSANRGIMILVLFWVTAAWRRGNPTLLWVMRARARALTSCRRRAGRCFAVRDTGLHRSCQNKRPPPGGLVCPRARAGVRRREREGPHACVLLGGRRRAAEQTEPLLIHLFSVINGWRADQSLNQSAST